MHEIFRNARNIYQHNIKCSFINHVHLSCAYDLNITHKNKVQSLKCINTMYTIEILTQSHSLNVVINEPIYIQV